MCVQANMQEVMCPKYYGGVLSVFSMSRTEICLGLNDKKITVA